MIRIEFKRLVLSKSNRCILALSIFITLLLCWLVVSFSYYPNTNIKSSSNGDLRGIKAVTRLKKEAGEFEGEINKDFLCMCFDKYHNFIDSYGTDYPIDSYYREIKPINVFLEMVWFSQFDNNGAQKQLEDITLSEAKNFYSNRQKAQGSITGNKTAVNKLVKKIDQNNNKPFFYKYGLGDSNTTEYLSFLLFFIAVFSVIIASPVFSTAYYSGEDEIVRCTMHGKKKLAKTRILAVFIFITILYVMTTFIFLCITVRIYGVDNSSIQISKGALLCAPLTEIQLLALVEVSGYLSVLSICSFSLFVSSKSENPTITLAISMCVLLLPTIIAFVGKPDNLFNWIRVCLPSGGVGFGSNVFYEVTSNFVGNFYKVSKYALFGPNVRVLIDMIWVVLTFNLAKKSYLNHTK